MKQVINIRNKQTKSFFHHCFSQFPSPSPLHSFFLLSLFNPSPTCFSSGMEMASLGPWVPHSEMKTKSRISWANIVGSKTLDAFSEPPLHLYKSHFKKTKNSTQSLITIDHELWQNSWDSMQISLCAKFFVKSLQSDQAKLALADAWRGLGNFTVTDLPNGFYYIRCESPEMQGWLLWEGTWTVAGLVLQLSPWRESFQLAFKKLVTIDVWLQIKYIIFLLNSCLEKFLNQSLRNLDESSRWMSILRSIMC